MRFSQRTNWVTHANPLTQLINEKKKEGEDLIDLTQSNPTGCSFKFMNEDWLKPLSDKENLTYEPDPRGLLEAREAICRYYLDKKIKLYPEQIFLTSSTSEAYHFIFRLLCDARDLVAVPRPSYPLFDYLTTLADVDIIGYQLDYGKFWGINVNSLEIPFIENPKAIILVNPNNPTGNFVGESELGSLNSLCEKHQAAIISDEVFLDFSWGQKSKAMSLAGNREVLTFVLSGASKILALPQMKLSWVVVNGPLDLREEAMERLEIISDTYLSVNTPSQKALKFWLSKRKFVEEEILSRVRSNYEILAKRWKGKSSTQLLNAQAGWYAVL